MKIRRHDDHEAYLKKQTSVVPAKQEYAEWRAARDYNTFKLKFRRFSPFIAPNPKIVCLGARLGTEVRAFRSLGHETAIGTDIGDYQGNDGLVIYGDFMRLSDTFEDGSIDFAYTNCFDHTSDPGEFLRGLMKALKPGGFALIDALIDQDNDWGGYWQWHPDSVDDLTDIMKQDATVLGWMLIKKPFNGRSYLLKNGQIDASDRDRFLAAVADQPHEIIG